MLRARDKEKVSLEAGREKLKARFWLLTSGCHWMK